MGKGRDKKKKKKQQQGGGANIEDTRKQRKQSQGDELKHSKKSKYVESSDDEDIDAIIESFKAKVRNFKYAKTKVK